MKKYKQLLLLFTTIVSVTLFLVYRHEYNRLHYVLEVFNFFGTQPCNISDIMESNQLLNQHDWGTTPAWQEYDDYYLYSSHWYPSNNDNDDNVQVAIVRSVVVTKHSVNVPKSCYLYYENLAPTIGKFKYTKLRSMSGALTKKDDDTLFMDYEGYNYDCHTKIVMEQVPYGVSYTRIKGDKRHKLSLINENGLKMTRTSPTSVVNKQFNVTICLFIGKSNDKRSLIEFVSYHALIGADAIVIYANNVPYRLIKLLLNFQTRLGVSLTFLTWNYPIQREQFDTDVEKRAFHGDCLLRTLPQSYHVIALETDEYLVPSESRSLNEVLRYRLKAEEDMLSSTTFSLPVEEFCVDNADDEDELEARENVKQEGRRSKTGRRKNLPMALQHFDVIANDDVKVLRIHNDYDRKRAPSTRPSSSPVNATTNVSRDRQTIKVHKYNGRCDRNTKTYLDKTIDRYHTEFVRATLVQFLIHDKI